MTRFYSLASSSSGNCSVFQGGGRTLLIDGGTNTKYIRNALSQLGIALGDITDVLITHTHSDHVSALPVLTKHCRAPIHATVPTVEGLKEKCAHDQLEVAEPDAPFWLGEVRITPFLTPHDCPGSCGFLLETAEGKMGYCTDLGHLPDSVFETLRGVETVFLESNHDVYQLKNGEYPYYLKQRILSPQGHLSNDDAAQAVAEWGKYGLQKVILAHLSEHNNRPEWALEETERALRLAGLREQVQVAVAPHKAPLSLTGKGRAAG